MSADVFAVLGAFELEGLHAHYVGSDLPLSVPTKGAGGSVMAAGY